MTHVCTWHGLTHVCDMTHAWHDSFRMCVTELLTWVTWWRSSVSLFFTCQLIRQARKIKESVKHSIMFMCVTPNATSTRALSKRPIKVTYKLTYTVKSMRNGSELVTVMWHDLRMCLTWLARDMTHSLNMCTIDCWDQSRDKSVMSFFVLRGRIRVYLKRASCAHRYTHTSHTFYVYKIFRVLHSITIWYLQLQYNNFRVLHSITIWYL